MDKGLFITFEGTDGAGKTTQIRILSEYLADRGRQVLLTREPGGTPIGEKLREIILDRGSGEMVPVTEALLYAASRAQHVAEVIRPALLAGKIVICDRFLDSSVAYQGYGRELGGGSVLRMNEDAVGGLKPDVTFFLKLPPGTGRSRIREEEQDRLEREALSFHERVFRGYEELARREPERVVAVDAGGTVEEVAERIRRHIDRLLG